MLVNTFVGWHEGDAGAGETPSPTLACVVTLPVEEELVTLNEAVYDPAASWLGLAESVTAMLPPPATVPLDGFADSHGCDAVMEKFTGMAFWLERLSVAFWAGASASRGQRETGGAERQRRRRWRLERQCGRDTERYSARGLNR